MQITITSVNVSKVANSNGRGFYEVAEVNFGEKYPKKIMSFTNPAVFATLKHAKEGEIYEVTEKQDGKYTNWTSATKLDEAVSDRPSATNPKPVSKVTGSTYETADERAVRQRLIVRQSSLAQAIEFYKIPSCRDAIPEAEDILALAEDFTAWVFKPADLFNEPNDDVDKDVPY